MNNKRQVKVMFHPILNVKKGYFHGWEEKKGTNHAIIEFEDRSFMLCNPGIVVFKEENLEQTVNIKFPHFIESVKGYIHRWFKKGANEFALVELQDGTIKEASSHWIDEELKQNIAS